MHLLGISPQISQRVLVWGATTLAESYTMFFKQCSKGLAKQASARYSPLGQGILYWLCERHLFCP
jgi:hypothetical protein